MPIERNRAASRIIAASALAFTPAIFTSAALAQAAGTERGVSGAPTAPAAAESNQATIELARAQTLSDAGQLVQAKVVLAELMSSQALKAAPTSVRDDVLALMKSVELRMLNADPQDLSLQKADLALRDGDFLAAERHAQAVKKKSTIGTQRSRADELLNTIKQRRNDLAPLAANALEQLQADYSAGRYSQAKGCINAIKGTGIILTEDQVRIVDRYQTKLLDLEAAQGRIYPSETVGLAVFQPGVVRRERPAGEPAPARPRPRLRPPRPPTTPP